jgi:phosphoribosyl 1,2-cyclic phosphodiesterase
MRIRFWGVRGGVASPGKGTADVGGNTSCVEVRASSGALIVLDAGIGLYWLGRSLLAGPHGRGQGEVTIFLARTHWDHIQGIPFFVPAFLPGNKVHIHGGAHAGHDLRSILEGQMREAYSPIVSLANMPSVASVHDIAPGKVLEAGGVTVRCHLTKHEKHQAVSVAYRLEEEGRSLVYVTDVEYPKGVPPAETVAFARDCDLLVHEAFYTDDERRRGEGGIVSACPPISRLGHATFGEATELALRANAKKLLYSHHHPDRDDDAILRAVDGERVRVVARKASLVVDTAREGVELSV